LIGAACDYDCVVVDRRRREIGRKKEVGWKGEKRWKKNKLEQLWSFWTLRSDLGNYTRSLN
jgi:hypothetical protein